MMMMNEPHRPGRVALLIDADNLSADVIEQAIEHLLKHHGAIHYRRAYCSPQKAMELMEVFRRHAIRPMVNVPTGKNSTDIALAVDAIDLALSERPEVVVIASSDSDYAPLAQRLREKGCRVLGIGQAGKTGSESPLAYDGFVDLAHRKTRAEAKAPPLPPAMPSPVTKPVTKPVPNPIPKPEPLSDAPATHPRPARGRPRPVPKPGSKPEPKATTPISLPPEVAAILDAVPDLRSGNSLDLNGIGAALRQHGLLKSRNASPSRLLKRHADHFELVPLDKPRSVRFRGARDG